MRASVRVSARMVGLWQKAEVIRLAGLWVHWAEPGCAGSLHRHTWRQAVRGVARIA